MTANGGVQYPEKHVERGGGREALDRAIDVAGTTAEYMRCMESASALHAEKLGRGYTLLSEYLAWSLERFIPEELAKFQSVAAVTVTETCKCIASATLESVMFMSWNLATPVFRRAGRLTMHFAKRIHGDIIL